MRDLLKTYRLEQRFDETRLLASWEQVMTKAVAQKTSRIFIKNKVLFVELTSAALKHELNQSKQAVLDRFAEAIGPDIIAEVVFM